MSGGKLAGLALAIVCGVATGMCMLMRALSLD